MPMFIEGLPSLRIEAKLKENGDCESLFLYYWAWFFMTFWGYHYLDHLVPQMTLVNLVTLVLVKDILKSYSLYRDDLKRNLWDTVYSSK